MVSTGKDRGPEAECPWRAWTQISKEEKPRAEESRRVRGREGEEDLRGQAGRRGEARVPATARREQHPGRLCGRGGKPETTACRQNWALEKRLSGTPTCVNAVANRKTSGRGSHHQEQLFL